MPGVTYNPDGPQKPGQTPSAVMELVL